MDREQEEMQFLSLFSVFTESFKIVSSWRKIFTQITLTLILPLSFIYLLHIEVTNLLLHKIFYNAQEMSNTPLGSPRYEKLSDLLSSEWATFWLFKIFYFTLLLIFSLLSTSAVVYTVASIYTARDFTFHKVMSVVPKVWKRLMVTFLCVFAAFFAYHIVAFLVVFIWAVTIGIQSGGIAILVIIAILFFAGFVYLTLIWQLASVVSVLEESYGVQAMLKSRELIKGKMGLAIVIFLLLNVAFILIQVLFKVVVVHGWRLGSVDRTAYAILCFFLLSVFFLFGLVIQTVLYFVCKSYHHENIDKSALSDHLEAYLGEYVPLKARDVQLEQYHV
ncbi:uncharacterized protein LOC129302183 [Prosopis cineraria]|uniref:uncharacterized protein LOC129302183 n=1 Tax=Prosopis cineraria TaxID=364024 RepID=UPI0024101C0C|nr:uncharacterized protein LOC129302183 [Prosopis cineraria]